MPQRFALLAVLAFGYFATRVLGQRASFTVGTATAAAGRKPTVTFKFRPGSMPLPTFRSLS